MISALDLRNLVIVPTLDEMAQYWSGCNTPAAVNLLIGTVAQESTVGGITRLKQIKGPALGIYQIEPATHKDLWDNYLLTRPDKADYVRRCGSGNWRMDLTANLKYQTVVARLKYWRARFNWPDPTDIRALGAIWDKIYNANPDHGTVEQFVAAFPRDAL